MGGPVAIPKGVVVPDGGWGWMVVLSSFFLQFLTIGITYTFGVLLVALVDEKEGFGAGESTTAWIGSIQPFLLYFTGLVSGPMIQRFGWRLVTISGSIISAIGFLSSAFVPNVYLMFLTYGGLTGIGNGFMYVTSMVAVQHYFDGKRAMATGIAVSGSGVGTLVFGYLVQVLLDNIGWRKTMIAEALISLIGVLCGLLLRPLQRVSIDTEEDMLIDDGREHHSLLKTTSSSTNTLPDNQYLKRSESQQTLVDEEVGCYCGGGGVDCDLLRNPVFALFATTIVCFCFNLHVPYTFTPDRAVVVLDVTPSKAAFLVSVMGISNVCSRLGFGWIGDKGENIRFFIGAGMLFTAGLSCCFMPLFNTYGLMVFFSILFGMGTGCWASLFPVILVDLLGVEHIEKSLGQSMAIGSFVFLIASPLSGLIIQKTNNFDGPYILAGSIGVIGSLVLVSIRCLRRKKTGHVHGYQEIPSSTRKVSTTSRLRYVSESFS